MELSEQIEVRVRFSEVDSLKIVWHGHYAKYFEIARCDLLDKIDYGYMKMRSSGYAWPIIDLRIRYAKPLKFRQKIIVQAHLIEWQNRLKINYQIVDKESGLRLARGYTTQVAIDMASREMCYETPAIIWEKLGLQKP